MNKRIICLVLSAVMLLGNGFHVLATTSSEVKKQQTETKNKLNDIKNNINSIESKKDEVRSQLSNLNGELVETLLTLEVLEADLEKKQQEIDEAQQEYEKFKALEEKQYAAMKLRIQYMYEKGSTDYVSMFLEAESISDLVNKADFVQEVYNYDDEKLREYEETKTKVAEKKAVLEEEQAELEEVQEAQQVYKTELDKKIASAKNKVANFETELANAQAKAKEYQATIAKQTALIAQLEEQEAKAAAQDSAAGGSSYVPPVSDGSLGSEIAAYAVQFVGNPYVSGGTSLTNGADCSGFTWAVHKHFGISIPRVSTDQANGGKSVPVSAVQPGDIIYYGHHVGIYIGNGKIVHASTQKTGIKINSYTYRPPICVRRYW